MQQTVFSKSIWSVKIWMIRCWHGCLQWCKWYAYGPADATATPPYHVSLESRMA